MIQAQVTAREIRNRLRNPPNGRRSSELEVCPDWTFRRRQAAQILEVRKAQQDFERRQAAEDLLRKALEERAHVMAIARQIVEEEASQPPPPTIAKIIAVVGAYYGFSTIDIRSERRAVPVVLVRHVVMYLCRMLTLRSLPEIGRKLGGRDHTTILHGVRKIASMIQAEPRLAADIDNIKWELGIR